MMPDDLSGDIADTFNIIYGLALLALAGIILSVVVEGLDNIPGVELTMQDVLGGAVDALGELLQALAGAWHT